MTAKQAGNQRGMVRRGTRQASRAEQDLVYGWFIQSRVAQDEVQKLFPLSHPGLG